MQKISARRYRADIGIGFSAVMERMRRIQARLSRADSARRLSEAGVDVYFGEARFAGPDTVAVAGQSCVLEGAHRDRRAATDPAIPGLAEAGYLTNENVFNLTELPRRLLVIGGGPLGCELAQAFCRFGSHVYHRTRRADVPAQGRARRSADFSDAFARDGVEIHLNTTAVDVRLEGARKIVDLVSAGDKYTVPVDEILAGIGRAPNVESMNLEAAGVRYDTETGIRRQRFSANNQPADLRGRRVCLEHKFTHTAEASARIAVRNALFLGRKRLSALTIPWCTYTDPEIAHIGLYVREAREKTIPVKTFTI